MSAILQPAVIGASGYTGQELVRLLARHAGVKPPIVYSREDKVDFASAKHAGVDVLFLATPHEYSRACIPQALDSGLRVIDLSGAWRLQCAKNREVYQFADSGTAASDSVQSQSIYGLPELHRGQIAGARLVANPGCYATSIILALSPLLRAGLVDETAGVICDSKSGVSGAGKQISTATHFMSVAENLSAYGLYTHRHTGELVEQLHLSSEQITFTPHLLPIQRGILSTIYLTLKSPVQHGQIQREYESFFQASPMVRMHSSPALPQIQHAAHTNFCDIGFVVAPEGKRVTIVSCLDNLLKGAAGQAVQNMNLMFGFDEAEGLL